MKKLGLICFLSPLICFSMETDVRPVHERADEAIAYEDLIQEPIVLSESELEVHSETAVSSQAEGDALEIQPVQRNSSKSYKGGAQDALKHSNRPRVTHREAPEVKRSNVVEEKQSQNTQLERSTIVDDFAEQDHATPPIIQQQSQKQAAIPSRQYVDSRTQKLDPLRNPRVRLRPVRQEAQSQEQIAAPEAPPHSVQEPVNVQTEQEQPSVEPQVKPRQQRTTPKVRQAPRQAVQTEEKQEQPLSVEPQVEPRQQRTTPKVRQAPSKSVQTEEKQEQPPSVEPQVEPRQQRTTPKVRQAPSKSVQTEEKQEQPPSVEPQVEPRQQRTTPKVRGAPRKSVQTEEKQEQPSVKPHQQGTTPKMRQAPRQSVQTEEKREQPSSVQPQVKPRQQRSSPALRQSVQSEEKQEPPRTQRQAPSRQKHSSPAATQNPSRNSVYTEEGQHQQRTSPQHQKQLHRESVSTEEGESKALSYHYTPNRVVLISSANKTHLAAQKNATQKRPPAFFERQAPLTKESVAVPPSAKLSRKERTQALVDQAAASKTASKQEAHRSAQPQSRVGQASRKAPPSQLQRSPNRVAAEREVLQTTPVAPSKASPGERAQRKQSNSQKEDKSYHLGRRTAG